MPLKVTLPYAALLALLFIVLSVRVIARRRSAGVSIGAGGDAMLERLARVHANCAEYAPFALLLMVMAELAGAPGLVLNLAGVALLTGRSMHAYGVSQPRESFGLRVVGMALTLSTIAGLAGVLVWRWITS